MSIFLSYRRADSQEVVGRLYDRLVQHFAKGQVFRDLDSLQVGKPFPIALDEALKASKVALIIIGPNWVTIRDANARRRLDDPADFVRREVENALSSGIAVVPVLVSNASMPLQAELPASLTPLLFRHGVSVRPDPDFHKDASSLIEKLIQIVDLDENISESDTNSGEVTRQQNRSAPQKSMPRKESRSEHYPRQPAPSGKPKRGRGLVVFAAITLLAVCVGTAMYSGMMSSWWQDQGRAVPAPPADGGIVTVPSQRWDTLYPNGAKISVAGVSKAGREFKVELHREKLYVIDMNAVFPGDLSNTWLDPYLRLLDASGTVVAVNDDARIEPGNPRDAQIRHVASSTGWYTIQATHGLPLHSSGMRYKLRACSRISSNSTILSLAA